MWDGKQDSNTTASREHAASTSNGPNLPGPRVVEEIGLSQATAESNYDSFENDSFAQFDDADMSIVMAEQHLGGDVASQEKEVSQMMQKE